MASNDPNSRFEAEALVIRGRIDDVEREQTEAKQRDEEYKKRSVEVQERMADLQGRMVVLTRVLAICAIVTGGISWWQISAAKRAAEAAERSAKIAESALDSSNDSFQDTLIQMKAQSRAMQRGAEASKSAAGTADSTLKNAQASFQQEQRAYLAVTYYVMANPPTITDKDGVHVCGDVHAANSGRTPALNVAIFRRATFGEHSQATVEGVQIPKSAATGDVLGTTGDKWGTGCTPTGVDSVTQAALVAGKIPLYIYGLIRYDDIFGNPHETGFCGQRVLNGNAFILCSDDNGNGFGNWFEHKTPAKEQ